jgi:hypothetical protein
MGAHQACLRRNRGGQIFQMHIRLEHVVAVGYLASFKELMAWLLEEFKSGGTRSSVVKS